MQYVDVLREELEELRTKYWNCYNNYDCEEDLGKIQYEMERLRYAVAREEMLEEDQKTETRA